MYNEAPHIREVSDWTADGFVRDLEEYIVLGFDGLVSFEKGWVGHGQFGEEFLEGLLGCKDIERLIIRSQ